MSAILSKDDCIKHMQASKRRIEGTLERLTVALGPGSTSDYKKDLELQHSVVASILHHLQGG